MSTENGITKHNEIIDEKRRILYIDVMRIVSVFMVIVIHTCSYVYNRYGSIDMNWWWISNIFNSLSRWSIPVMVMVSGILLLDPIKEYPIHTFFKKRLNKVVVPLVFWSIVYTVWRLYREKMFVSDLSHWSTIVIGALQKPVASHLWFVYMMLGLYLLTPVLRVYIKNTDTDNLKYFLVVWIMTNGVVAFTKKLTDVGIGIELFFFTGYMGYYILGYYLVNAKFNKKEKVLLYFLTLVSFVATMTGTFILTEDKGSFDNTVNGYLNLNVIIMSIGVFVFIKSVDWEGIIQNHSRLYDFISDMGSLSFGIYLVHLMILEAFAIMKINAGLYNPIISIPGISATVMLISYIIVKLMRQWPMLNKTVP